MNGSSRKAPAARRVSVLPTSTTSTPLGRQVPRRLAQQDPRTASMPSRPDRKRQRGSCPYSGGRPLHSAAPDIGRIADDDIVAAPPERRENVRLHRAHAPRKAQAAS